MPHARSSWGSNDPVGRGRRRLRFWADLHDGRGYRRHSKTIRGTWRDGEAALKELWQLHADDAPSATMGRVYELWWLPEARERVSEGSLAPATLELYETTWRNHIAPNFASQSIQDIRPTDVQTWLLTLTKWNAVNAKSLASSIAEKAVLLDMAQSNPFARKYRMPVAASTRTKTIWTLDEISRAVDALHGSALEVPTILCALGSCRVGEACAARSAEVSFTTEHGLVIARVPITRQLMRDGRVSDKLKNRQSVRTVCIPEPWSLRLREIASSGDEWLNDDGYGSPVTRSTLKVRWAAATRKELSSLPRTTMQNLRSSWETFMRWELGVDGDLVDSMMGHAGTNIRTRHYDRPAPDVFAETCALAHLGAFKKG